MSYTAKEKAKIFDDAISLCIEQGLDNPEIKALIGRRQKVFKRDFALYCLFEEQSKKRTSWNVENVVFGFQK